MCLWKLGGSYDIYMHHWLVRVNSSHGVLWAMKTTSHYGCLYSHMHLSPTSVAFPCRQPCSSTAPARQTLYFHAHTNWYVGHNFVFSYTLQAYAHTLSTKWSQLWLLHSETILPQLCLVHAPVTVLYSGCWGYPQMHMHLHSWCMCIHTHNHTVTSQYYDLLT